MFCSIFCKTNEGLVIGDLTWALRGAAGRCSLPLACWLFRIGPVTFCIIIPCGSQAGGDAAAPLVCDRDPKALVWICRRTFCFLSRSDGTELQREGRLALSVRLEHPWLPLGACAIAGDILKLFFSSKLFPLHFCS